MSRRRVLADVLKLTGGLALVACSLCGCDDPGGTLPAYDIQGRPLGNDQHARDEFRARQIRQNNNQAGHR